MSKLKTITIESKKVEISALPPLEIQLGGEGYLLKKQSEESTVKSYLISLIFINSLLVVPVISLGALLIQDIPLFVSLLFFPTFYIIYRILKLALDESARHKMGTDLGFVGAELIFSHYPLKVGEDDRVTFRRRLKTNYWTNLFKVNKFPVDSHIKINLVRAERASYSDCINTITYVAVVYEKTIYSDNLLCGDREVIAHFDLEIPLSCGSSFEGKYNKIRWILAMEESYPGLLEQKHTYLTFIVDS